MRIGYARVSTAEQHLHLQEDALKAAGCEKIFTDTMSGAVTEQPGLQAALDHVRPGDVLVVWKLDWLGQSLLHLIETVQMLHQREMGFQSLQEAIDTTTPGGQLVFHIFAALAEFERALIRERTQAGLAAARARGRLSGRPRMLTPNQVRMAEQMVTTGGMTHTDVARALKMSRSTLYRVSKKTDLTSSSAT